MYFQNIAKNIQCFMASNIIWEKSRKEGESHTCLNVVSATNKIPITFRLFKFHFIYQQ